MFHRASLLVEPALYEVPGSRLEFRRFLDITHPMDDPRASRVEAAATGWVDQTGRFPGRDISEAAGVLWFGIRDGIKQCLGVGMEGVSYHLSDICLLDHPGGIHYKDAF